MNLHEINRCISMRPFFINIAVAGNNVPQFEQEQLLSAEINGDRLSLRITRKRGADPVEFSQIDSEVDSLWVRTFRDPMTDHVCFSTREPLYVITGFNTENPE